MGEGVSRRNCILALCAALAACVESRAPLRRLELTLTRDFASLRAAVRSFAEREGYQVHERDENDVIGDDMIQLESWRSSILVSRDLVTVTDMTPVYSENTFEAIFYGPSLTIAEPLSNEELDQLVVRFTHAIVSANAAEVVARDA